MSVSPQPVRGVDDVIYAMEAELADIERWARLLMDLGCSEVDVRSGGIYVIGEALDTAASLLRGQWTEAFELCRTKREGAPPCA